MTATSRDRIADVRSLADAVLFEGYMLYPYRANDPKNTVRWQFGVLAPPAYVALDPSERDHLQLDCLLEGQDVTVQAVVRFLHVQRRVVEGPDGTPVAALDVGNATYLPWDEAVIHECELETRLPVGGQAHSARCAVHAARAREVEQLTTPLGGPAGRLVRERNDVTAELTLAADPLPGPYGVRRLRLQLTNTTPWPAADQGRPDALRHALVAAHLILSVEGGAMISLIDPPEWARGYAERCEQIGTFPVLAGAPGDNRLVLAAPIILYDHPQVAPESASQFCDATEMDEMLTLRTLTLTESEKRQARGSDPRAAALIDEIDSLPPELMDRLHGAIRSMNAVARPAEPAPQGIPGWWTPEADRQFDPDTDVVLIGGVPVGRGCAVRLRPGRRRADAQDMFLAGRTATVEAVLNDLDGDVHVAITLDELAELAEAGYHPHGRFLYFAPDEIEPLGGQA